MSSFIDSADAIVKNMELHMKTEEDIEEMREVMKVQFDMITNLKSQVDLTNQQIKLLIENFKK